MTRFRQLLTNMRGSATVEFAFTSIFLFGLIMVALDFGFASQQRLKLGSAVEQAAILAYNQQTGSDTSAISTYVTTAAQTNATPTVTITCNGTATCGDNKCSCITATGGFTAATTSCGTTCAGSSAISGNYMKIAATMTYQSMVVPDRWLGGSTISSNAVVRLQ